MDANFRPCSLASVQTPTTRAVGSGRRTKTSDYLADKCHNLSLDFPFADMFVDVTLDNTLVDSVDQ